MDFQNFANAFGDESMSNLESLPQVLSSDTLLLKSSDHKFFPTFKKDRRPIVTLTRRSQFNETQKLCEQIPFELAKEFFIDFAKKFDLFYVLNMHNKLLVLYLLRSRVLGCPIVVLKPTDIGMRFVSHDEYINRLESELCVPEKSKKSRKKTKKYKKRKSKSKNIQSAPKITVESVMSWSHRDAINRFYKMLGFPNLTVV